MNRFSEYRVMWILVFFDLPTETKKDKKAYMLFRKHLQSDVSVSAMLVDTRQKKYRSSFYS